MKAALRSTIRLLPAVVVLSGPCALLPACSKAKHSDWFHFGKDKTPELSTESPIQRDDSGPADQTQATLQDTPQTTTQTTPQPATDPITEPLPEAAQTHQIETQATPPPSPTETANVDELVHLYRRLHVELDQAGRSQLIVELLNDRRERVRLLGFDLASRDLSAGATLNAQAANAVVALLSDPLPSIRTGSARLITRLALPDAMTLLTRALTTEQDPAVAEAILRGIERWPNPDARADVLRWYQSVGPARAAAASAAWGIADLGLWDKDSDASLLRSVYRSIEDGKLSPADMRLIATTGASSDIDRLITLARSDAFASRANAAGALVYTPLGVDPLIALAKAEPRFSPAAADAIERHRLNPNGIRQLAALPWTDPQARIDTLVRVCSKLDNDQLSDAIRLARTDQSIDDELTIRLLSPLIAGLQSISPRSAPGVVLLAQLELAKRRPDRALEILSLVPSSSVAPDIAHQIATTKATAHIFLQEFDQAAALDQNPATWLDALDLINDTAMQTRLAKEIIARSIPLTQIQHAEINAILDAAVEILPVDETTEPEPEQP